MQVQNTTSVIQSITIRENLDAKEGEIPRLFTIHIPQLATVEIDDKHWMQAWNGKTTVPVYVMEEVIVTGSQEGKPETQHVVRNPVPTGRRKDYWPLRDLVERGILKIVERPASNVTVEKALKIIQSKGVVIDKTADKDKILDLYEKLK